MAKKACVREDVKLDGQIIGYVEYDTDFPLGPIWWAYNTKLPPKHAHMGGGSSKNSAKKMVRERHEKYNFESESTNLVVAAKNVAKGLKQ